MASTSQLGIITVPVDGAWDIEDLRALAESLSETYGLFYPLVAQDDDVRKQLQDLVRKQFWSGDIDTRHFGQWLYRAIPKEESLKLKSFTYHSPGAMELSGVLVVLLLLSRVARSWIATGSAFIDLWAKVDKFFERRKSLRRPKKKFEVSDDLAEGSDEARALVLQAGHMLGFDDASCEVLIGVAGNPISALKYLVAAANEARKLADLEREGLIKLPHRDQPIALRGSETSKQRKRARPTPSEVRQGIKPRKS
ncbi:hypothetical protein ACKWRH_38135 [Bradyrhizobium sp. Pa8]|uniref:hypothetical protein n=1 Tax=Bradyrhizobium sp. Pa8 TaxID=3386552 RepID=UPI00403F107D